MFRSDSSRKIRLDPTISTHCDLFDSPLLGSYPKTSSGSPAAGGGAEASVRPHFPFLPFPSKGFNFFPKSLPKISIHFQKLQKISAIRDLSMGYGRAWPETSSAPPAAGGSAEASVRPRATARAGEALAVSGARAADTPELLRSSADQYIVST